jgi:hypothetical protein
LVLRIIFFFIFFASFLTPFAQAQQGKGHGVEVRLTSPKMIEVQPGKIITNTFVITNYTDQEADFFDRLNLPSNWQAIPPLTPFKLRPGESQVKIIALSVPATEPTGRYEITYTVRSQRNYAVADSDFMVVRVLPSSKLEFLTEEKPSTVIAGEAFSVRVRLLNR